MRVRVIYDTGHDYGEFEYFSKYNRINAKGIKEEIKSQMIRKYGRSGSYYTISQFYRVD